MPFAAVETYNRGWALNFGDWITKSIVCCTDPEHPLAAARAAMWLLTAVEIFAGCSTERSASSLSLAQQGKVDMAGLDAGIIVITSGSNTATIHVDPPNRRMEPLSEGAAEATRSFLNTPNLGNPQLEAGVGAVQFALAPFAAAYGAIKASQLRLSPGDMSEAQWELAEAIRSNAVPETLAQKVGEIARQKTRRLLVYAGSTSNAPAKGGPVSAMLEVAVEHVGLRVSKPGGSQYCLTIEASARLVRTSDNKVLIERSYHYESGPGLFVDWTRYGGLEGVTQTGYQTLAEQIAEDVFEPASEPPILIGPGQKRPRVSSLSGFRRSLAVKASLQFVSLLQGEIGSMEIHTSRADERLREPKPGPESGSNSGAMSDTKWSMDGLEYDRNAIVQGVSCLAVVPAGIWEQTIGLIRKHSHEKTDKLVSALRAATTQWHMEGDLADELTRRLQSQVVDSVKRADEPMRFVLASFAQANPTESSRAGAPTKSKTALEIQVLSTRFVGKHRNSRSRAVVVEIQATIFRTSDGQEIYSRPIRYRSSEKRLKDWASSDAKLFHQELDACSQQTAEALARDLIARGFVTPLEGADSRLLQHSY